MSVKPSQPSPPGRSPDNDVYGVTETEQPVVPSQTVEHRLRLVEQHRAALARQSAPPPRLPLITDALVFPFRLHVFGPWMTISAGSILTGWLTMFWIQYGTVLGMTSARLIGLPVCLFATMTFGYAASCCLTIIEETSYGRDGFEIIAGLEWKEWVWKLGRIVTLGLFAGIVGLAVESLGLSETYVPMAAATFVAFPIILLGALATDGAWVPLEILPVLRSLVRLWYVWGVFFIATGLMAAGWTWLTVAGLVSQAPWLTPLYAGPLLATLILVYVRFVGRLAARISAVTQKTHRKGDHRE